MPMKRELSRCPVTGLPFTPGMTCVIQGPAGSGKTRLAMMMASFTSPLKAFLFDHVDSVERKQFHQDLKRMIENKYMPASILVDSYLPASARSSWLRDMTTVQRGDNHFFVTVASRTPPHGTVSHFISTPTDILETTDILIQTKIVYPYPVTGERAAQIEWNMVKNRFGQNRSGTISIEPSVREAAIWAAYAEFIPEDVAHIIAQYPTAVLESARRNIFHSGNCIWASQAANLIIHTGIPDTQLIRLARKEARSALRVVQERPDIQDRKLELAAAGITATVSEAPER